MVRLNRIYTRTGDDGSTGLGDGSRLAKHHPRIAAYGTVDELSSLLGLVLAHGAEEPLAGILRSVQNDLFDVGADLCVPGEGGEKLRIQPVYTERLEGWIDEVNEELAPLTSFVLAGGSRSPRGCTSRARRAGAPSGWCPSSARRRARRTASTRRRCAT